VSGRPRGEEDATKTAAALQDCILVCKYGVGVREPEPDRGYGVVKSVGVGTWTRPSVGAGSFFCFSARTLDIQHVPLVTFLDETNEILLFLFMTLLRVALAVGWRDGRFFTWVAGYCLLSIIMCIFISLISVADDTDARRWKSGSMDASLVSKVSAELPGGAEVSGACSRMNVRLPLSSAYSERYLSSLYSERNRDY
jgi:hypothetical protein